MLITFVFVCWSWLNIQHKQGFIAPDNSEEQKESLETEDSVDPAELVDRTVQEQPAEPQGYAGGNGTVIEKTEENGHLIVKRKFEGTFQAKDYSESDQRNLYAKPDHRKIEYTFSKDTSDTLVSSVLHVATNSETKENEAWIFVHSSTGHAGWLYVGNSDPFEDDNWKIVGTVSFDGKRFRLRKYSDWFSADSGEPAYDRPSIENSRIIWNAQGTPHNSQINLEAMAITDEILETAYWVKVKDAYGRIGWFPGNRLGVERGGFNYLSPENIVRGAFGEE